MRLPPGECSGAAVKVKAPFMPLSVHHNDDDDGHDDDDDDDEDNYN